MPTARVPKGSIRAEVFRCQQSVHPRFLYAGHFLTWGWVSWIPWSSVHLFCPTAGLKRGILQWCGAKKHIWALTTAQIGCDETPVYRHTFTPNSLIPAPSRGAGFKSGSFLAFFTTNLNFLRLSEVITESLYAFFKVSKYHSLLIPLSSF